MRKKLGLASVVLGAVLVLAALALWAYNRREDAAAGAEAETAMQAVQEQITQEPAPADPAALDPEMPVAEIDGHEYVGYVAIPSIELELPVMADWDYDKLKLAPCRQFGSSRMDDLVIAGHNYKTHFGKLDRVAVGDAVTFTDMDGIVNHYTVEKIETLDPTMVDQVENSGYALVLYTCTYSGQTRTTLFCGRDE